MVHYPTDRLKVSSIAIFFTATSFIVIYMIITSGMDVIYGAVERKGVMAYFYVPFSIAATPFIIVFWIVPCIKIVLSENVVSLGVDGLLLPNGKFVRYSDVIGIRQRSLPRIGIVISTIDGREVVEVFAAKGGVSNIVRDIQVKFAK